MKCHIFNDTNGAQIYVNSWKLKQTNPVQSQWSVWCVGVLAGFRFYDALTNLCLHSVHKPPLCMCEREHADTFNQLAVSLGLLVFFERGKPGGTLY